MRWVAARVVFEGPDQGLTADLIAGRFFDLGLKGVVVDDPDLAPAEGWGAEAVKPSAEHAVTGYFEDDERTAGRCRSLETALERMAGNQGFVFSLTYIRVDEADWAEAWKEFFYPEKISPGLVVKPTWRHYDARAGETIIEIDPGMAFGTGTHPTTVLCLQLIEKHLRPEMTFLDVGTGSGILMIAAAKLGARQVTGVDNDPTAVAVACKNLDANGISSDRQSVVSGSLVSEIQGRYDLVAANILAEVIVRLAPDLPAVLAPGGRVICSGIIRSKAAQVSASLEAAGLEIVESRVQQDWVAIVAGRKADA
jgi:ribosomal protein L11 methyltransferase